MQLIISNTTEVGIVPSDDDIHAAPPPSFPGKLLAFLYERYKAFKGSDESGMVIVPTELIGSSNAKVPIIDFKGRRGKKNIDGMAWHLPTVSENQE